jgi:hypothetical protein
MSKCLAVNTYTTVHTTVICCTQTSALHLYTGYGKDWKDLEGSGVKCS